MSSGHLKKGMVFYNYTICGLYLHPFCLDIRYDISVVWEALRFVIQLLLPVAFVHYQLFHYIHEETVMFTVDPGIHTFLIVSLSGNK